jgi:hypothetical protein
LTSHRKAYGVLAVGDRPQVVFELWKTSFVHEVQFFEDYRDLLPNVLREAIQAQAQI